MQQTPGIAHLALQVLHEFGGTTNLTTPFLRQYYLRNKLQEAYSIQKYKYLADLSTQLRNLADISRHYQNSAETFPVFFAHQHALTEIRTFRFRPF